MNEEIIQNIWMFVRGDLDAKSFEAWVYQFNELESILSEEFYLEIISTDYKSASKIYELRQKLEEWLRKSNDLACQCVSLANIDITHMGSEREDEVFKTLQEIKAHGEPLWWLALHRCSVCMQNWLTAQETRQNDVHCFKRLTNNESDKITKENSWPEYFRTYEELLKLGKENGCSVHFIDPLNSSPVYTAIDLAKERPGISVSEIASLLDVSHELAIEICKKAIFEEQVDICIAE